MNFSHVWQIEHIFEYSPSHNHGWQCIYLDWSAWGFVLIAFPTISVRYSKYLCSLRQLTVLSFAPDRKHIILLFVPKISGNLSDHGLLSFKRCLSSGRDFLFISFPPPANCLIKIFSYEWGHKKVVIFINCGKLNINRFCFLMSSFISLNLLWNIPPWTLGESEQFWQP